ncbi:MAG: hypothetical protein M3Z33_00605 [Actinomycetota bacterium]|nr:hypothetical protein [Actinomycetota bacterium]
MFNKVRSGVVVLAALGAMALGASAIAGAASNTSTSGTTGGQAGSSSAARPDPATLSHGPGETVLTDGTADKVKQAALAKVSGATVLRVETDSQGSPYEAHLRKSDGNEVTVKVSKQFAVTAVDNGFGAGPPPGSQP